MTCPLCKQPYHPDIIESIGTVVGTLPGQLLAIRWRCCGYAETRKALDGFASSSPDELFRRLVLEDAHDKDWRP